MKFEPGIDIVSTSHLLENSLRKKISTYTEFGKFLTVIYSDISFQWEINFLRGIRCFRNSYPEGPFNVTNNILANDLSTNYG